MTRERRPHPLTPLIRGWIVLLAILIGIGREFIPDGSGQNGGLDRVPIQFIVGAVALIVLLSAAGSFLTWWFTRYVIDENELRIETGMATKRSRRIGFNRIQSVDLVQPLAARLFSLAELRVEAGSGDGARIRYLPRKEAARLRDYLLARAHGQDADPSDESTASALSDRATEDTVIVTIKPAQLIGGLVLSGDFLIMLVMPVVVMLFGVIFDFWLYVLPAMLPYAFGLVGIVSRRVINQFNYSLADTGHGLRITRGLTNLTSQSLPVDRIQGLRIRQPLLWRRLGWHRVDVDVLGYGSSDEGAGKPDANSLLLPVATREQLRAALAGCLPGIDPEAVPMTTIPRRARWLRWWNFWTIKYGVDDHVAINTEGWLTRKQEIVPHGKTQSARISQGPLQRRLGLADVHIDTTKGPVDWQVSHLDATDARDFVLSQMVRAHRARSSLTTQPEPRRLTTTTQEVPDGFAEPDLRQE